MKRVWHIIKREYLENVRTKAFVIGLVLTPVWMGMIFLLPLLRDRPDRQDVVIVDETGVLAIPLQERLEAMEGTAYRVILAAPDGSPVVSGGESVPTTDDELKRRAGEGKLVAIVLTAPILEKRAAREGERAPGLYCASTTGAMRSAEAISNVINSLVTQRIVKERKIPEDTAKLILKSAVSVQPVGKGGEKANMGTMLMPFLTMMLLYMGIVGISQMLISSTLEEKGNRVYEVLLSSVSPFQLMAGKILGICGVGLTLLTFWSGGGIVAASAQGAGNLISGAQIGWFFTYYLLGFLMIASLMVAIGSACNTLKEAQNLMAPLSMMLALPLILAMVTMGNPNGTVATVCSFIPPFTPFMMMARIAGAPSPPDWQVWATLVLLALGTYCAIRLAARVFRVGILLYGQPPTLGAIWRWMWEKD